MPERFFLFPSPVFVFDVPMLGAANAELVQKLTDESLAHPGIRASNSGGWHSVPDLALRPDPVYQNLLRAIVDHVGFVMSALARDEGRELPPFGLSLQAWAMVMRQRDYVSVHDHGDSHWSVAYYVDAGDASDERSGQLCFVDPRRSGRSIPGLEVFKSDFFVKPRTGALVIFPGWLQHFVRPYEGTRPRVCVSCNLSISYELPSG